MTNGKRGFGDLTEPVDIEVCADCLAMIANGELGQGDDQAEREHGDRMDAYLSADAMVTLGRVASADYDPDDNNEERDEVEFSWHRCDSCGSTLGGYRHLATLWVAP